MTDINTPLADVVWAKRSRFVNLTEVCDDARSAAVASGEPNRYGSVEVGETHTFYASYEGFATDEVLRYRYSGQAVTVVDRCHDWDAEQDWGKADGLERGVIVEAADGARLVVYEGELNNWYRDTQQYCGTRELFEPAAE